MASANARADAGRQDDRGANSSLFPRVAALLLGAQTDTARSATYRTRTELAAAIDAKLNLPRRLRNAI